MHHAANAHSVADRREAMHLKVALMEGKGDVTRSGSQRCRPRSREAAQVNGLHCPDRPSTSQTPGKELCMHALNHLSDHTECKCKLTVYRTVVALRKFS